MASYGNNLIKGLQCGICSKQFLFINAKKIAGGELMLLLNAQGVKNNWNIQSKLNCGG